MPRRILFLDKGVVSLQECDAEPIRPNAVRIKAQTTLISTGTEGICLHRLFEPDTHWDQWVKYPFRTGYCMVGTVTELGPGVETLSLGQRVVARIPHGDEGVETVSRVVPVPDGVANEDAAWFALAMIGFMGAKAGQFALGDSVLVVGAGPIGQMALRWAVSAGARHAVSLDTVPMRLEMAKKGGATAVINGRASDSADAIKEACGGEMPRVVVDSTGYAAVFEECLKLPRHSGTVILLGDSGTPSQQRLTLDVVRRGIQIHGAHVSHETAQWHEQSIVDLFFSLLERGIFRVQGLNTHWFKPDECEAAYELTTNRRTETMGVLFDWTG